MPVDPAPFLLAGPVGPCTGVVVAPAAHGLPALAWVGECDPGGLDRAAFAADLVAAGRPADRVPPLPEEAAATFARPGLAGHRVVSTPAGLDGGRDWAPSFTVSELHRASDVAGYPRLRVTAADATARLSLATELQALPGGAVRARHTLTNDAPEPYVVDRLEVVFPVDPEVAELLDGSGRWGRERVPQRHAITDGVWLRAGRAGKPGPDSPTVMVAATAGVGFAAGRAFGLHVGWSGNSCYRLERLPTGVTTLGGGEQLLPGEVVLAAGQSYAAPWVYLVATDAGLDGVAAAFHGYLRSLPAHPDIAPVNLNVWEAVYFDHRLDRLVELAERAARIGVERYVLDDGWFGARRDDTAGLGDWTVSPDAWPDGLHPLVDRVHALGMDFGLWFEPEMVNPDSDLYRAHPEWILATGGRRPSLRRNQLVLDLGRPEVRAYLLERIDAILSEYRIDYVKWDHNRNLDEGGSGPRGGAPGVHAATFGYYELLDELARRHPAVGWESCASGGARIDLGVLSRAQRVWTSDVTDALSRQQIQRWTAQLVAPEYLGAHVSAPRSHQTGRAIPLAFRAATAFFCSFGIEWDITTATDAELAELAGWIGAFTAHRGLLHGGRMVRIDVADPAVWMHGVVSPDRTRALMAYVQLDESAASVGPALRFRGLDPARRYRLSRVGPPTDPEGPWELEGAQLSGTALCARGVSVPIRRPLQAFLVLATAS